MLLTALIPTWKGETETARELRPLQGNSVRSIGPNAKGNEQRPPVILPKSVSLFAA